MDELEVLKREWQTRDQEFPKLSSREIYPMLLRKSSSLVKWIFYISIAELVLWTSLAFVAPESSKQINEAMGLKTTLLVVSIIGYVITFIFIYLFYKNYRSIKVTDSIKNLMGNILRTRKTVRYFVFYNIGAAILLLTFTNIYYYSKKETLYATFAKYSEDYAAIPPESFTTVFFTAQIIVGVLLVVLLVIFYRLVYGILLRRLKRNYKELKKIEV
jgi:membrane-associated HD superfamily phosphohydrolase